MISINLISFLLGIISINKISTLLNLNDLERLLPIFLFSFWPLAGIYAVIYPLADYVVIGIFLLGLTMFLDEKPFLGAILWGLSLITHKAIWPFVAIAFLVLIITKTSFSFFSIIGNGGLIVLPLAVLWLAGSTYHSDKFWLFSSNLNEIQNNEIRYPFRGILDTLLLGDNISILKFLVLIFFIILTVLLVIFLIREKPSFYHLGLGLCFATIIYAMTLNEGLTWAFTRFSRLLVFPIMIIIRKKRIEAEHIFSKPIYVILIFLTGFILVCSQFIYAFYITLYFNS
jgi:hypothetical protein